MSARNSIVAARYSEFLGEEKQHDFIERQSTPKACNLAYNAFKIGEETAEACATACSNISLGGKFILQLLECSGKLDPDIAQILREIEKREEKKQNQ